MKSHTHNLCLSLKTYVPYVETACPMGEGPNPDSRALGHYSTE